MKANGGLISKEDLAKYEAKERTPLRGTYKGFEVISMPPVSSGGIALIEMLNILEPMDLKSKGVLSAEALHLQIEAMRRAYLDRARHVGDPDFVKVPIETLISKEHARKVAASIDPAKASSSLELGKDIVTVTTAQESDETTHYSVIDRNGMAVTTTTTLEGSYGSHVVVKGAGFLLNNEMGDFNKKPGETNATGDIGTPANLIDPGNRMLSSMKPSMVVKDGKVVLLTGSPGGRTIINTVFTIVFGVVEYGMNGRQAVDLARMHHQWLPDRVSIETENGPSVEVLEKLKAMGHNITAGGRQGDAHSIWVAPDGTVYGINELRTPDGKASVPKAPVTAGGR
jgi:gamma-glutamyltranspeptidase/glutathione hydrolase